MAGRRAGLSPIDEKNFWGGPPPPPYTSMATGSTPAGAPAAGARFRPVK